ncbi:MAG: metal-sensing transcriptional repressor [Oscillospiraceae bacterium]|nr:metal-sensing transcriptional repressor [Oscillospiraceae bacterium]
MFIIWRCFLLGEHKHTKAVIKRLARSVGHLSAVKKMVEEGRDCSEVLIQLSAVKAEIAAAEKVVLKDHIEHCVADAVLENDEETMKNLMAAIDKII